MSEHQRSVRELLAAVLTGPQGLSVEACALGDSRGRILAADVRSGVSVPPVANSQMDGFAVRTADLSRAGDAARPGPHSLSRVDPAPVELAVGPLIAAGHQPGGLAPGQVRPIMTGAPLPVGADAVIPVEETEVGGFSQADDAAALTDALPSAITVRPTAHNTVPGRFVRAAGSDTERGDRVARAGDEVTPRLVGLLASVGVERVEVRERPRVVVVSTGSELVRPGMSPDAGQVFDANGPALAALLTECGADVVRQLFVVDDPNDLLDQVTLAVRETHPHVIVSTGGVSAGAVEPIRQLATMADAPVRLAFDKVAMQPGGPQGLGVFSSDQGEVAWVALPGNPVSAMVSVEMFVREPLSGLTRQRVRLPIRTLTGGPESSPEGLLQVRRARLTSDSTARFVGGPSSHLVGALALSDALVLIEPDATEIRDRDVKEVVIL